MCMQITKRSIAVFVLSVLITTNAAAQNLGTTFSDVWWNPNESGWGMVVAHQQNFMFTTFYIYRADGSPYWVTGQLQKVGTSGLATSPAVFTGPVYETHGPWFGGAFNSAAVGYQYVGTATFSAPTALNATLQYSIDGVSVTKNIERQTLSNINFSSQYAGGTVYQLSQCIPSQSSNNGRTISDTGLLTVVQSGTSFHMDAVGQDANCSFNGTYLQNGSLGQVNGNYSCLTGEVGTFTMYAMQWTLYGMTAGVTGQSQFCRFNGFLGGITGLHIAQ